MIRLSERSISYHKYVFISIVKKDAGFSRLAELDKGEGCEQASPYFKNNRNFFIAIV